MTNKKQKNIHISNYILRTFLTVAQQCLEMMEVQHNKTSPVGFNQLAQESFFFIPMQQISYNPLF